MLGDLEGDADADRGEDLRRRPGAARRAGGAGGAELGKVDGVVDVVGPQARQPRGRRGAIDPLAAGAPRPDRRQVASAARRAAGSASRAPSCGCSIAPCRCACATPTRALRPRDARRDARARQRDGQLVPLVGARARRSSATGRAELLRENLRQMALVTARLEGRDLGSAVAEIQRRPRGAEAAGGLHATRSAASTSRSGRRSASCCWSSASPRCWCFVVLVSSSARSLPALLILLAAPLSLGGAFAAACSPAPS